MCLLQRRSVGARMPAGGHLLRLPPHGTVQAVQLLCERVLLPQQGRLHRLERRSPQLHKRNGRRLPCAAG